jgi:hypothetical protein
VKTDIASIIHNIFETGITTTTWGQTANTPQQTVSCPDFPEGHQKKKPHVKNTMRPGPWKKYFWRTLFR